MFQSFMSVVWRPFLLQVTFYLSNSYAESFAQHLFTAVLKEEQNRLTPEITYLYSQAADR